MPDKLLDLAAAVSLVPDGASLSLGGFTTQRHPMAFVHELIRRRRRNLYLIGHSPGGDWDHLIGAGCVKRVELAYEADEAFGTIGPRWRLAVQRGTVEYEDYSNFAMVTRFNAGAMGLPFLPLRSLLGSDVAARAHLSDEARAADARTPDKKLVVMENPWPPHEKVVLVPAARTEFSVLHAQAASPNGIVRIAGPSFADVQQALAADRVIVTAEQIVSEEELRAHPEQNLMPHFAVHHVVHVPWGGHPYAVHGRYDYDPVHLKLYHDAAEDDAAFAGYLDKFVFGTADHAAYLDLVGRERLEGLRVDETLGYRPDLKRRGL